MPKDLKRTVNIPDGVTVVLEGNNISVTGPRGSSVRELWYPGITIVLEENQITMDSFNQRKKQVAMMGTIASHISNMINGVTIGYTYRMKVLYSHFPILSLEPIPFHNRMPLFNPPRIHSLSLPKLPRTGQVYPYLCIP